MFTGFARTLNGRLSTSVWLASRSRRHASASEPWSHNPPVTGVSICVASHNLSSTSGGHRRGSLGRASDAYTIQCRPSHRPGFLIRLSISLRKGALTLDAAILLGAGADGRLLWRLVVIVVHALCDCQARIGGIFRDAGFLNRGLRCLCRCAMMPRHPFVPSHPHPDPLPSRERGLPHHPAAPGISCVRGRV